MNLIPIRPASAIAVWGAILVSFQSHCSNPLGPGDQRLIPFNVHNGYSAKNSFVETGPTTCLVFKDKAAFDSILYWIPDHNPFTPIPDTYYQTKIFPVVIKKGNSYWTMDVDRVGYVPSDKTLHVYFRATLVADNLSWVAAVPLVLSVQSGDYSTFRFYENGKLIGSVSAER